MDPGERLRRIQSFGDLFAFLRDDLDWPITTGDLEEATFDWQPDELGIPLDRAPNLQRLRQLRPLTMDQPWGIFFVEFAGPRLPITPLRRLLQSLVLKKRASGDGTRRTWDLNDLLFIVTTDSGESIEFHFIAFFEVGGGPAEVRSLPWRPRFSPARHLRRLATELLPQLTWPDDASETSEWRTKWRLAFKLRHGEPIASASRLAERMADTARDLKSLIQSLLADESGRGPFSYLMADVRKHLVANLDSNRFADMCAQTLVYGVLSSRVTDPEGFGASPSMASVPLSNTFLSAFFDQVHDAVVDIDAAGTSIEELVADLRATNVEAILDQFGSTAKGGDPVIHFYEEFLKSYDRQLRADSGAFYTPQPVVSFMVRGVHEVLRDRFSLPLGIADDASWASVAERGAFEIPDGVDPESSFVSMLDPATGTGTFLVEWLRQAAAFNKEPGSRDDPDRLRRLLGGIHAFELMLGPYAVAHLKVALELHDLGVGGFEPTILLTDTLDHLPPQQTFETMEAPLAVEGLLAAHLKRDRRFSVIIGNPPYDREQRQLDTGGTRRTKGGVVRHGVPGIRPLIDDILEPMREAGLAARHARSVYNDYVYFWRWAGWQAVERIPGPGVVCMITAASYLDGVSMGGLRSYLRSVFDELHVIDLGGEGRGAELDENVFEIRTPVAICFAIRTAGVKANPCRVHYARITGTRSEKFQKLGALSLSDSHLFEEVRGEGLSPFVPRNADERRFLIPVIDLMPWTARGVQFSRTWPVGESPEVLEERWRALVAAKPSARDELLRRSRDAQSERRYRSFLGNGELRPIRELRTGSKPDSIERLAFRSFDRRWCIADRRVIDMPRPPLWAVRGPKQLFFSTLVQQRLTNGPHLVASVDVPDLNAFNNRGGLVIPQWRDVLGSEPNLTEGLLEIWSTSLGEPLVPEDAFFYIYGCLGTAAASDVLGDKVEDRGPVVPLTTKQLDFRAMVELGRKLVWIHTWGEGPAGGIEESLRKSVAHIKRPPSKYPETFDYISATQELRIGDGTIGSVPSEVWEFEISGLPVLASWLGYRMSERSGRTSSALDDIRPHEWIFTDELLGLVELLEQTIRLKPRAQALLEEILRGPLLSRDQLALSADDERQLVRNS